MVSYDGDIISDYDHNAQEQSTSCQTWRKSEEGGGLEQGEQECSGPADQVNTCFSFVGTNPGLSLIG